MSDFDENMDPLDPRFVDAVLARARQRASAPEPPAPEPNEVPHVPAPAPAPMPEHVGVTPVAPRSEVAAPATRVEPLGAPAEPHLELSPPTTAVRTDVIDREDAIGPSDLDDEDDGDDSGRRTRNAIEWIAVAVGAVIVAFLIRAFLLQAFYIPSESMEPTLRKNDRILVNKLSYKLHDINRGDLVVFEKPPNEPASDINDLIKRVIARPNETIELHTDGTITIDGLLLNEPYLVDGQAPGPMTMARDEFVEGACTNPLPESTKCTLGEGFIFVMGDNRNHSHDSRAFGPIDEELVVGRAFVKVWPLSEIGFL